MLKRFSRAKSVVGLALKFLPGLNILLLNVPPIIRIYITLKVMNNNAPVAG